MSLFGSIAAKATKEEVIRIIKAQIDLYDRLDRDGQMIIKVLERLEKKVSEIDEE